jgi:hypothetical protein
MVLGSDPGQDTGYTYWSVPPFSSIPPDKIPGHFLD